jgi:hypothetical protein
VFAVGKIFHLVQYLWVRRDLSEYDHYQTILKKILTATNTPAYFALVLVTRGKVCITLTAGRRARRAGPVRALGQRAAPQPAPAPRVPRARRAAAPIRFLRRATRRRPGLRRRRRKIPTATPKT